MKGIVHALVALGIIFVAWILILSFAFNITSLSQRQIAEAKIILDAEDAENIVRSLENSFRLSFVQGIYDSFNTGDYWISYNENRLTDSIITSIKSGNTIKTNFESYANGFLNEFANYVQKNKPQNTLLVDSLKKTKLDTKIFPERTYISVDVQPFEIKSNYRAIEIKTNLDFTYSIQTKVIQFLDMAKIFVQSRRFSSDVMGAIRDYANSIGADSRRDPPKATYSYSSGCGGSEPSDEQVFESGAGRSRSTAQTEIGETIKKKLQGIENELTVEEQQKFVIEHQAINSGIRGINTEIRIDSCQTQSNTCYLEGACLKWSEPVDPLVPIECLGREVISSTEYTKTCTYSFYGKADTRIRITDWNNKYTFWDKADGKAIFNNLGISFNAVAGNK